MPDRRYDVFGPFEIPRTNSRRRVDRSSLRDFWNELEALRPKNEGLASASGCYIFGIRAGKGAKPWYVGQATRTFRQECFTPHKLVRYNEVLTERKGTPLLFLLARMTPTGRFAGKLGPKEADWVENQLIHHCLSANDDLLNVRGTAFSAEVIIPGLLNSPQARRSTEVQDLRSLLSLQ